MIKKQILSIILTSCLMHSSLQAVHLSQEDTPLIPRQQTTEQRQQNLIVRTLLFLTAVGGTIWLIGPNHANHPSFKAFDPRSTPVHSNISGNMTELALSSEATSLCQHTMVLHQTSWGETVIAPQEIIQSLYEVCGNKTSLPVQDTIPMKPLLASFYQNCPIYGIENNRSEDRISLNQCLINSIAHTTQMGEVPDALHVLWTIGGVVGTIAALSCLAPIILTGVACCCGNPYAIALCCHRGQI